MLKKDEKIKNLEERVEDLEQYTRQDDVIITGLKTEHQTWARKVNNASVDNHADAPASEIDTLESQVIQFLEKKDIDVDKRDISIVHTLEIHPDEQTGHNHAYDQPESKNTAVTTGQKAERHQRIS